MHGVSVPGLTSGGARDHVVRKYVQRAFQPLKYIVGLLLDSLSRYNPGFPPQEIVHGPQRIG